MGFYDIQWKKSAVRDLRKIDRPCISRIIKAVDTLVNNPYTPQSEKLQDAEHIYRLRVGDYRVVYEVNSKAKAIIIYHVRYRKEIYRR